MTIVEAIDSATSEHTIRFLVTAYIESLQHTYASLDLPEALTVLPLRNAADLRRRLALVSRASGVSSRSVLAHAEARAVFSCALQRLHALEGGLIAA